MFEDGRFFTPDGRARFIAITPSLPKNQASQEWPFTLNTGRVRDQWHTMTRTGDAASLAKHTAQPYVEIHPKDAKSLGIEDKALVRLTSPYGEVLLKAKLSRSGCLCQCICAYSLDSTICQCVCGIESYPASS